MVAAFSSWPFSIRFRVSTEKVENVVNAPSSPISRSARSALPAPGTFIDAEWLALPEAAADYLGRRRGRAVFGACLRGRAGAAACG